ncbi:MAG: hypothetical protein ACTSX9_09920 [Candidatus Njordarchaeales archaeon]
MKNNQLNEKRDISSLLHRIDEIKKIDEKRKKLLDTFCEELSSREEPSDNLIYVADQLFEIGKFEIKHNKHSSAILPLFAALVTYKLFKDDENLMKCYGYLDTCLKKFETEALNWHEWDNAYISYLTLWLSKKYVLEEELPLFPEYLNEVHPLLREVAVRLDMFLKGETTLASINELFHEVNNIATKYSFEKMWGIFKEVVTIIGYMHQKEMMKGVVAEEANEENAEI